LEVCCALANCGGGKLVLGVTDKRPRKVVGSSAFPQPERTRACLKDKLRVGVDFELYGDNGKRVLAIEVASRPLGLPIQVDGIAWWYIGDSLVSMPEDVRRRIYAERGHDFSAEIRDGVRARAKITVHNHGKKV
jgi:ATP-dependent DNA helicase RecG